MKKLLMILMLVLLTSCTDKENISKEFYKIGQVEYYVTIIDGCEYLISPYSHSASITHKGNCKNPIHRGNP